MTAIDQKRTFASQPSPIREAAAATTYCCFPNKAHATKVTDAQLAMLAAICAARSRLRNRLNAITREGAGRKARNQTRQ